MHLYFFGETSGSYLSFGIPEIFVSALSFEISASQDKSTREFFVLETSKWLRNDPKSSEVDDFGTERVVFDGIRGEFAIVDLGR